MPLGSTFGVHFGDFHQKVDHGIIFSVVSRRIDFESHFSQIFLDFRAPRKVKIGLNHHSVVQKQSSPYF